MTMVNVDRIINLFREFLNAAWQLAIAARPEADTEDFMNAWLQANWETLVEASFPPEDGVFLLYYGDGADLNPPSGRVVWPEVPPTHEVVVLPVSGESLYDVLNEVELAVPKEGIPLGKFVSRVDRWFNEQPPFDHILMEMDNDLESLVRVADCKYVLRTFEER